MGLRYFILTPRTTGYIIGHIQKALRVLRYGRSYLVTMKVLLYFFFIPFGHSKKKQYLRPKIRQPSK